MRKSILFAVFLFAFSISAFAQDTAASAKPEVRPSPTKLPDAKDVIERYVKALGGREAIQKQKTKFQSGTIELSPMGLKGTIESYARSDNKMLTKVSIAGIGDLLDGYDGKVAWSVNPIQGSRIKEGKELLQTQRDSIFHRDAVLDKIYKKTVVRGIEKEGDRPAYVVVASSDDLPDEIWYFDTQTGLMLRSDTIAFAPEGSQPFTQYFGDYRAVDGVLTPHSIRARTPVMDINTVITVVKYGLAIDDAKFVQPKE